ncbi:hypothetical protein DW322_17440 [Rhodococcus rhodnii]|uniref:Uncharacterized protein n=2 Tax=Rhodococcus rhodnii TaxID=38312 RepID=R7WLN8_9NOCA|nr:hypothetical protein [Rhodococcus rhodnii]EOM74909.1 hypothetical protein Rrhod_3786 [Rhodococcus rhodnii LMG 5362]TXG91650.1 hypothetical protein DW322_17440 [Rhodococcus rhodnii]
MSIMIQVLEQGFSSSTPWEQRKYAFVDAEHMVTVRLDGARGVWLDGPRAGESHQLALTEEASESIYFLLRTLETIAECRSEGGSWLIGHDGRTLASISASPLPFV